MEIRKEVIRLCFVGLECEAILYINIIKIRNIRPLNLVLK